MDLTTRLRLLKSALNTYRRLAAIWISWTRLNFLPIPSAKIRTPVFRRSRDGLTTLSCEMPSVMTIRTWSGNRRSYTCIVTSRKWQLLRQWRISLLQATSNLSLMCPLKWILELSNKQNLFFFLEFGILMLQTQEGVFHQVSKHRVVSGDKAQPNPTLNRLQKCVLDSFLTG